MAISTRAARLLRAIDHYKNNTNSWDAKLIFPRVNILEGGNGCMIGEFTVTEDICNVAKTLHGGFSSSLIDVFSLYASLQHAKGAPCWTTDMNITYLGMAQPGDVVRIDTKPLKMAKTRIIMECSLYNKSSGTEIAKAAVNLVPDNRINVIESLPFDFGVHDK